MITESLREDGVKNVSLHDQPFASPEKVHDVVAQTYRNLKQRKSDIQESMSLYLANKDTEHILFRPIKVRLHNIHFFVNLTDTISS